MRKLKYLVALASLTCLVACEKGKEESPSFDVTTEKIEYKVGEQVDFLMSGKADIVSFYSGEKGKEYEFRNRIEVTGGTLGLNMDTQVLYGNQDNLRLIYSTDFNGLYDTTSVRAATWTDISDRFAWATAASGAVGVRKVSGMVNISDLIVAGKPLYFAFKYVGNTVTTGATTTQRTWRVYAFDLTNTLTDGSVLNVATAANAGWLALDFKNPVNKWTIQTSAPFIYFTPSSSLAACEDWVISKALFPNSVTPSAAIGIKALINPLTNYQYTFTTAGTYKSTFVATNASNNGEKSVIKEIELKITP